MRSRIEELILQASKEDTSLKTVLDDLQSLYTTPLVTPKPKRRKTDIRTLRRNQRGYRTKRAKEQADIRREAEGTLYGQFHKLRREVKRRRLGTSPKTGNANWDWELSIDDWCSMWLSCPPVQTGFNNKTPAWMARGRSTTKDVQLRRVDTTLPFRKNNLEIWYRGAKINEDA